MFPLATFQLLNLGRLGCIDLCCKGLPVREAGSTFVECLSSDLGELEILVLWNFFLVLWNLWLSYLQGERKGGFSP